MIDKLSGENAPKLHLVAFNTSEEIQSSLSNMSRECHGHFHSHTPLQPDAEEGASCSVRDSDIDRVREEVGKRILCELKGLEHGNLGQQLMETLREVS